MNDIFDGKTLLITGGTGSFGHAVTERFLKTGVKEIRILSRDEKKQEDMRRQYRSEKLKFYIGDVRDHESITDAFKGVDYVFHAAALKQVPSCEFYPLEAIKTNVLGSENVVKACAENKVRKAVFLSTDKAAYPVNAMGETKALMEKVVIAASRQLGPDGTVLCLTRYGNVMGSRGSVIPLFFQEAKTGYPITVTNPKMTRFIMSFEEAVELVLYAFAKGKQGDLFVQKAPSVEIGVLAQAIKELTKSASPIELIGTRHGEKLYETLITSEEMVRAIDEGPFYRIPYDARDLNYENYVEKGSPLLNEAQPYTSESAPRLTLQEMKEKLRKLDLFASL